jgi:glycosyltransferase involved in cell wall biosynthesis
VAWGSRIAAYFSRFILANSGVTAAINSKFFGIRADGIWNPLREWPALPESPQASIPESERKQTVLFCGRAIPAKRAYEAFSAFVTAALPSEWSFEVAGPLGDERLIAMKHRFVHHGTLSPEDVTRLMRHSRILVTLNELEPYGLVIEEAARACMVIVTCRTGGAVQELERQGYSRLVTVQQPTIDEVADAYRRAVHL